MAHPSNPDYGHGAFRRRIRLSHSNQSISAELEDCNHGFRLNIQYRDHSISTIDVETVRYPLNTCPGAAEPLQKLIGCRLDANIDELKAASQPRSNCTHLYDLALLAMAHGQRPEGIRVYDVEVPDSLGADQAMTVYRDGQLVHHWLTDQQHIVEPAELLGKPIMKGFSQWSQQQFDNKDQLEAAQVLQRGFFVARARRVELNNRGGHPAIKDSMMAGACYSYSPEVIEQGIRLPGTVRDFSDCPEQLLTFQ